MSIFGVQNPKGLFSSNSMGQPLQKSDIYFSNNNPSKHISLVFVMGLKGSGNDMYRLNPSKYSFEFDDVFSTLLHSCWANPLISTRITKWGIKPDNICNTVKQYLSEKSVDMNNEGVLFVSTMFSYPFEKDEFNYIPDIKWLVNAAEQINPTPFDVKIIGLRRDWVLTLIASLKQRKIGRKRYHYSQI